MYDFDTERLILEVKSRPAIWNFDSPEYGNKHHKHKAWEGLCHVMIPDYEGMDVADKINNWKLIQRRWRNLRDCYTRELNSQIQPKPGFAGRNDRKQYVFFSQLSFLRHSIEKRKSKSSLDEEQDIIVKNTTGNGDEVVVSELTPVEDADANVEQISLRPKNAPQPTETFRVRPLNPPRKRQKRSREREVTGMQCLIGQVSKSANVEGPQTCQSSTADMHVHQDISKRFAPSAEDPRGKTRKVKEDEDRLFLLSLLHDIKKVHEDDKLELKSEMILLIKKWQRQRSKHNFHINNEAKYFEGNCYSCRCSGPSTGQHCQVQTSSGMPSSTIRIPPTSQRYNTEQSPTLFKMSSAQSPASSDTSCESPSSNCSE